MKRATPLGIVLLIGTMTVVPAVLHGRILNRWGVNKGMVQASQSLLALPDQFGDFVKIADQEPLSDRVQRELGVAEHIRGRYSNGNQFSIVTTKPSYLNHTRSPSAA